MLRAQKRQSIVQEAKRSIILDAAIKVFSVKGFRDARLEDIAGEAGFSKASLYNYYTDKVDIYLSLSNREHQKAVEEIASTIARSKGFETTIRNILQTVFSLFKERFAIILNMEDFQAIREMSLQSSQHEAMCRGFVKEFGKILKMFEDVIDKAKKQKEIQSRLDSRTLAGLLGTTIRGTVMGWKMMGSTGNIDAAVDSNAEFILHGFRHRKKK